MSGRSTVVLTISRQLGSGGAFVGQAIASRFGMRYADRDILREAAKSAGLKEGDLEPAEETASGFWDSVLQSFSLGGPDTTFVPPTLPATYTATLFELEGRIIREIADRFDAVIVGRGGFHILAGRPNVANVMLHAARAFRARRLMELYGLGTMAEAEALVDRSDEQRARFIRRYTGKRWDDPGHFDLCVDTGSIGLETATEVVAALVEGRVGVARRGGHAPAI